MANANVKLQFEDVLGGPLDESDILIEFFSLDNSQHFRVVAPLNGAAPINVSLTDPGNDIYRVMITPVNYRVIQFFLRIAEEQTTTRPPIVLPVDPAKVADIDAPRFDDLPCRLRIFCPMRRWPILRPVPVSRHRKVALFTTPCRRCSRPPY